jgi:hypothetical protein
VTLVERLQEELVSLIKIEYSFAGEDFPIDTLLEDGENVTLVSSTFEDNLLENVYCIEEINGSVAYLCSSHSDGGVVVFGGLSEDQDNA